MNFIMDMPAYSGVFLVVVGGAALLMAARIVYAVTVMMGSYLLDKTIDALDKIAIAIAAGIWDSVVSLLRLFRRCAGLLLLLIAWRMSRGSITWAEFRRRRRPAAAIKTAHSNYRQAVEVFGLAEDHTRADLDNRFKVLAKNTHPDRGGSGWLFNEITKSRKIIMEERGWK